MSNAKVKPARIVYDRSEIRALLGVSDPFLRRLVASGEFPEPDVRLGKRDHWKTETVKRWIESGGSKE